MKKSSQAEPHYALILFNDGAFGIETFGQKIFHKQYYQKGSRLFGVPQHLRVDQISEWLACGMPKHPFIVEYAYDN